MRLHLLKAEILSQENDLAQSISLLKEAIAIEDALNYNEPPDWFFSARHNLGALLLDAGMNEEAVEIYLEDLDKLPKNGWALKGLLMAYTNMGKFSDVENIEEQLEKAWANADVELTSSVIK